MPPCSKPSVQIQYSDSHSEELHLPVELLSFDPVKPKPAPAFPAAIAAAAAAAAAAADGRSGQQGAAAGAEAGQNGNGGAPGGSAAAAAAAAAGRHGFTFPVGADSVGEVRPGGLGLALQATR